MVLTVNAGSSSLKFNLFDCEESLQSIFHGEIAGIGTDHATLSFGYGKSDLITREPLPVSDIAAAGNHLPGILEKHTDIGSLVGIGHRIVHGMDHTAPARITSRLLEDLKKIQAYDPDHLPGELRLIESFSQRFPGVPQVACFDTSFHATMPDVARRLAIPRRYDKKGIQRYGFHGLSYAYLLEELERIAGREAAQGKVIMAHLGSGASLAAIHGGQCLDTSMGFTPASGIPMSTRSGDLDPGVAWYFMEIEKMNAPAFNHLINHESGLLGVSETSSDMQQLLKIQSEDHRAAEAIELFCYQAKKWIGAYAAVLGGLDTLVFSGGIGEHAPAIRAKICQGMGFLGIDLNDEQNARNAAIISPDAGKVCVRVIKTNEEHMIAKQVCQVLLLPVSPSIDHQSA